ncbi:MAG: hypothetical protein AAFR56_20330, partial [Chloroflexota bacterium]
MPYSQIVLPYGRTRKDRYLRMVRAIWHDTRALMTEFRLPIIAFLIATVGGGWAYGQLLEIYDP